MRVLCLAAVVAFTYAVQVDEYANANTYANAYSNAYSNADANAYANAEADAERRKKKKKNKMMKMMGQVMGAANAAHDVANDDTTKECLAAAKAAMADAQEMQELFVQLDSLSQMDEDELEQYFA